MKRRRRPKFRFRLFASHLDDGEWIMEIAHRHLYIYLRDAFKTIFFGLFMPVVLYAFMPQALTVVILWVVLGLLGMLYHFIDWYCDAWLITNVGVIDIERHGLFDRNSTRVDYHMIEGISYSISGFMPTVLNFGDITLDKLGVKTSLVLKDATGPKNLERKVIRYQDRYVRERSVRDHDALKGMLSEMIAYHVQNKKISVPND